jgi:hypothetical protein
VRTVAILSILRWCWVAGRRDRSRYDREGEERIVCRRSRLSSSRQLGYQGL